jgi:hypothetical protein
MVSLEILPEVKQEVRCNCGALLCMHGNHVNVIIEANPIKFDFLFKCRRCGEVFGLLIVARCQKY